MFHQFISSIFFYFQIDIDETSLSPSLSRLWKLSMQVPVNYWWPIDDQLIILIPILHWILIIKKKKNQQY